MTTWTPRQRPDAELEKTHGYALFVLILPGLMILYFSLVPFFRRGKADGTVIRFIPQPGGPPTVTLPQARVFSREYVVRLKDSVSAEFFRRLLADRGFAIEDTSSTTRFSARRT